MSWVWLIVRVYTGWLWLGAGWEKIQKPAWVGGDAGGAITGFVRAALEKTTGPHADVAGWYAWFLSHAVLPYAGVWSHVVAFGELFVGIGLILGIFTTAAAFFGGFMNMNYLLAGTLSSHPFMLLLAMGIVAAREIAGRIGLDKYIKPWFARKLPDSR